MFSKEETMRRVMALPPEEFKAMVYRALDAAGVSYVPGEAGIALPGRFLSYEDEPVASEYVSQDTLIKTAVEQRAETMTQRCGDGKRITREVTA